MKNKRFTIIAFIVLLLLSSCAKKDIFEDGVNEYLGRTVEIGSYYKKDDSKMSPIVWQVFDVTDDSVYLLSHYIIDCIPFLDQETTYPPLENVWGDSYIREWLNNEFYQTAFNEEEKSIICLKKYTFLNHSRYESMRRSETSEDYVSLLTPEQAENICSSVKLTATATPYAIEKGVFATPNTQSGTWWLMSPGYYSNVPACVDVYGGIRNGSYKNSSANTHFNADYVGVRPVIVISYDDFVEIYDEIHTEIIN